MRVALNSSSRRFLQRAPQIPLDNFDNPQRFTHRLCISGLLKKKRKKKGQAQPNRDGYIRHSCRSKLNTGLYIQGNLCERGVLVCMMWKSKAQMFHWCALQWTPKHSVEVKQSYKTRSAHKRKKTKRCLDSFEVKQIN